MENPKLSKEELQKINDLRSKENQITFELGQLEISRLNIEARKSNLTEQFSLLRKDQTKLGQDLQDKYGEGTIDIDSGEFIKSE
tara:strand:- start:379 stop:630 length:252 start_codon:yes stop_codon:yes gene_type:complete